MMNIPEFYEAFNVKNGDKMYRSDSSRSEHLGNQYCCHLEHVEGLSKGERRIMNVF
jgi:hypothetical protein